MEHRGTGFGDCSIGCGSAVGRRSAGRWNRVKQFPGDVPSPLRSPGGVGNQSYHGVGRRERMGRIPDCAASLSCGVMSLEALAVLAIQQGLAY